MNKGCPSVLMHSASLSCVVISKWFIQGLAVRRSKSMRWGLLFVNESEDSSDCGVTLMNPVVLLSEPTQ